MKRFDCSLSVRLGLATEHFSLAVFLGETRRRGASDQAKSHSAEHRDYRDDLWPH